MAQAIMYLPHFNAIYRSAAITGDPRAYGRVYISTNGRGAQYGEPA
ncbi:hypothetical protein [Streptomyces sp. NPDC002328]